MNDKPKHEVTVGNIGTVYSGTSRAKASRVFRAYRELSLTGSGRVSHEPVTWVSGDEILGEYHCECNNH